MADENQNEEVVHLGAASFCASASLPGQSTFKPCPEACVSLLEHGEAAHLSKAAFYVSLTAPGRAAFSDASFWMTMTEPAEWQVTVDVDTARVLGEECRTSVDSERMVTALETAKLGTCRELTAECVVMADALRSVAMENVLSAETQRDIFSNDTAFADTERQVLSALQGVSVGTSRTLYAEMNVAVETARSIIRAEVVVADSGRSLQAEQTAQGDMSRDISQAETATLNVTRLLVSLETAIAATRRTVNSPLQATFADTARRVGLTVSATTSLQRDIFKVERVRADMVITIPYRLYLMANRRDDSFGSETVVDRPELLGIQSATLSLNERTLADTFQMVTARHMEIEERIQGQLLDFSIDLQVEETSQQGLMQTVKGMYPLDRLLYTAINIEVKEAKCSYYAEQIAGALGLQLNFRIEDFQPSQDYTLSGMTYQDFISSLFSWTSRLPQRQVNVFIRGKVLNVIQRGYEESVTDITGWPHTMPIVNRKIIRSVWDSASTIQFDDRARSDKEYEPMPFTGTIGIEGITRTYLNGLLVSEENNGSTTEYYYDDAYLTSKRTHNPDGSTVQARYVYATTANDIYLFKETERTTEATKDQDVYEHDHDWRDWTDWGNKNFTERVTYHSPIGYGWYATTVYVDNEFEGSSISQGRPGGKSSQFTINESNRSLGSDYDFGDDEDDEDDKIKGKALFDTEFPVEGDEFLKELTRDIEWLNRKRQEEVSLDIVSKVVAGVPAIQHIIDFKERVRLDGQEYYLASNQVSLTPRSLRQKLRLVRWYA